MTVEEILKELKKRVTDHRYTHTLGVIKEAKELALIHGLDIEKCTIAAALHDFCKGDDITKQKCELIEAFGEEEVKNLPVGAYHAYSAFLEAKKLGVTDIDILNSIKNHTTGRPEMSKYEMLIFVSDFSEEGRTFPEAKEAHKIARESLYKATYYVAYEVYKMLKKENKYISPITASVIKYYEEHQND